MTITTPISGTRTTQKYFPRRAKGKLCSKFGEDRSITELTILAVVAGWTDTGRTDGQSLDAKVNLYCAQCYTLHWTDKKRSHVYSKDPKAAKDKSNVIAVTQMCLYLQQ